MPLMSFNPIYHIRAKHIKIDQHFVRKKVEEKEIEPMFVRTDEQVADIFTKGLTKDKFWFLKSKLFMVQDHAQLEGGLKRSDWTRPLYRIGSRSKHSIVILFVIKGYFCTLKVCIS